MAILCQHHRVSTDCPDCADARAAPADATRKVVAELRDRLPQWFGGARYSVEHRIAVVRITYLAPDMFGLPTPTNLDLQADDTAIEALAEAFTALAQRAAAAREASVSVIDLPTTKPD